MEVGEEDEKKNGFEGELFCVRRLDDLHMLISFRPLVVRGNIYLHYTGEEIMSEEVCPGAQLANPTNKDNGELEHFVP